MKGMAASTIGGSFALAAFAVAIVAGLASGNPAASVLLRALIAMLICYPVGLAVGFVAQARVSGGMDGKMLQWPFWSRCITVS